MPLEDTIARSDDSNVGRISDSVGDALSELLVEIAEDLTADGVKDGSFGYGIYFQHDTMGRLNVPGFGMRPFCWCDQESCPWCAGFLEREEIAEFDLDTLRSFVDAGFINGEGAPNFVCRETGLMIWWYKYIGRSMHANRRLTLDDVEALRDRFQSWRQTPKARREICDATLEDLEDRLGPWLIGLVREKLFAQIDAGADDATIKETFGEARDLERKLRDLAMADKRLDDEGTPRKEESPFSFEKVEITLARRIELALKRAGSKRTR